MADAGKDIDLMERLKASLRDINAEGVDVAALSEKPRQHSHSDGSGVVAHSPSRGEMGTPSVNLYTVTMLESETSVSRGPIAVCTSLRRACDIVEGNDLDIHETNHEYAVVAVIGADAPYGLLANNDDEQEIWYRWVGDDIKGRYERHSKPRSLELVRYGL